MMNILKYTDEINRKYPQISFISITSCNNVWWKERYAEGRFKLRKNKSLLGIIYLFIGLSSAVYGAFYLFEMNRFGFDVSSGHLMFIIPALILSGISFYFGVKLLK